MPTAARRRKAPDLPQHDHASDHRLLLAARAAPKRRLRDVTKLDKIEGPGELACRRIREFAWDLGEDLGWQKWMAEVARRLGTSETTAGAIIKGERVSISMLTIKKISVKTGIPYAEFFVDD